VKPRTTAILLLVALALGGIVWLSNRHEGEKKQAEERAKRLFGELAPEQIEWIALTTPDGKPARLERKQGAWRVVEPVDSPADAAQVDGLASSLAGMTSEAVIEEAQAPEIYGLGDAAKVVRFSAAGAEHALRIGKKTPVGANSYAATGDGKVYTIPTFRTTGFDRPLDDLRERRPVRFDRENIERIEVSWQGGGASVEKKDGAWRVVAPLDAEADDETVDTLLSDLVFLRASGFVDAPPPDAEVGLDAPQYRVVLLGKPAKQGEAPPRSELVIGAVLDTGTRVARGAERALYKIPIDRFDKLPKTVVAFRQKQLAKFVATDAARFELVFQDEAAASHGESRAVTVTGERKDEGWTTSPDPMAAGSAARLVAELARLKAVDIAAEEIGAKEEVGLGLAPPRVAIRVFGAPAKADGEKGEKPAATAEVAGPLLAELHLGAQQGDRIFASVPGRKTLYQIDGALAQHVPISLEAFRNRFVSKEQPGAPGAAAAAPGGQAAPEPGASAPDESEEPPEPDQPD
jgi:hypothetical protein